MLQESLGGNSRTVLILNVSPSPFNRDETLSTLRFGRQAKRIVNTPRVNKDRSPAELLAILNMRDAEISRLRAQVDSIKLLSPNKIWFIFAPFSVFL